MPLTDHVAARFRADLYRWFAVNRRDLPWRRRPTPYRVFVSEIMLQQTQVNRVAQLFPPFVARFPSFRALADAPLKEALAAWSGLGYNRRGKWLQEGAAIVVDTYHGRLPKDPVALATLPGIGPATAASIAAFAYDLPTVFIETNVRAVFIHHFFADEEGVSDAALLPYVEATLDREAPGRWYSALMDYGTELKRRHKNPARKSAAHTRQSTFAGSLRQVRGRVVKQLTSADERGATVARLAEATGFSTERIGEAVQTLVADGIVTADGNRYRIV
jgi:A/G-specific adenine glycosylase